MTGNRSPAVHTRPEAELLLDCARTCVDSRRAQGIRRLLQKEIDWTYLLDLARRHAMIPLLYWSLNTACPDAVPAVILNKLRYEFDNNTRRNLLMTAELFKVLTLLRLHEISAIPYRGPTLAALAYGSLSLRQFCDLDVLVRKQDMSKTKNLLLSEGYRSEYPHTQAQERSYFQTYGQYAFRCGDSGTLLELHWRITAGSFFFPLDPGGLWRRLEPVSLAGKEVLTFSPEDTLLTLCVHGAKHVWERLAWVCDVAKLITAHPGMDWGQVVRRASIPGGARMLLLGVFLASDLLGTSLPKEVSRRGHSDPVLKSLASEVRGWLFRDAREPTGVLARCLFHIKTRDQLWDRVGFCLRHGHYLMAPKRSEWTLWPLPDSLFPFYYVLRPIRLIAKHAAKLSARLLRRG